MLLDWADFKSRAGAKSIQYFDTGHEYRLIVSDGVVAVQCVLNKALMPAETADFEANHKPGGNGPLSSEVVTQLEKPDKDLVLASVEAAFSGTVCTLQLQIPGTLGDLTARYVAGGYAFTNIYGWNDRVTAIQVLDKDYVYAGLAYPATPLAAGVPGATAATTWSDV